MCFASLSRVSRSISVVLLLVLFGPAVASAQLSRGEIPNTVYWLALSQYNDGDFASARKTFQEAYKSGVVTGDGRWVDSICFHTMLGECYYELGDVTQALDQYASALKMFLANQNWMLRIDFPPGVDPAASSTPTTWGTTSRATRLGNFTNRFMLIRDTLTATAPDAKGGFNLVTGKEAIPVRAQEIARCTALAIKRRKELMGPTCSRDRLTDDVLAALTRRPAPANNWSNCWIDVQLGLAYSAAGKDAQAASELSKGLQAIGLYDHHLTSIALLELGHLSFAQKKYEQAAAFYLETTYSAAQFGLYDDLEEGLRGAQLCWLMVGKNGVLPSLPPALDWAGREKVRKLDVAIRLLIAENMTLIGDAAGAANMLTSAQKNMLRKEMQATRMGARYQFEVSRVNFAAGNLVDGGASLATALKFQQNSSKRLFQIALADAMVTSGAVGERDGDILYAELLREPTADDWATDPYESLTVASTPYPGALGHWFEVALRRKEPEKAMEIADRLRRQHFFATLPLGGRLLALRWILEAPLDMLPEKAQQQRRDLLQKYPRYSETSLQAAATKKELDALPVLVAADDDDARKKQSDLYVKLAKLSTLQEVMLRDIAVRREASDFVFPPPLNVAELQKKLPDRTLAVAYSNINGKFYAFALGKEQYATFAADTGSKVLVDLKEIYKSWGYFDKNQVLDAKDLTNTAWQPLARKLLKSFTNQMKDQNWSNYDELVIVPDSILWYLPFETLPLGDEPDAPPLISKVRIRYVPTMALAMPESQARAGFTRTGVVAGKLFPRDDISVAAAAFDELNAKSPGMTRLFSNLPAPSSLLATQLDQLIVYHDLEEITKGPYDWSPCPVDKAKAASHLGEWLGLPWNGPRQVLLPGFHTASESGLKKGGTGEEMFLTSCALLASGTKTALISRWRPAGQTSYDLLREFALESPHSSASAAWQRSVQLAMESTIDPEREPRIKASSELDGMKASHPFFWAGYALIDTGAESREELERRRAKPAPPVEKKAEAAAK